MEKTRLIEDFIDVWTYNCNMLSLQPYEFDTFKKIIDKLRTKSELDIIEKRTYAELIALMAETIDNYHDDVYQSELNCCYSLLNYLEMDISDTYENENLCIWCAEMPPEEGRTLCVACRVKSVKRHH